jgi:hypothetical protein
MTKRIADFLRTAPANMCLTEFLFDNLRGWTRGWLQTQFLKAALLLLGRSMCGHPPVILSHLLTHQKQNCTPIFTGPPAPVVLIEGMACACTAPCREEGMPTLPSSFANTNCQLFNFRIQEVKFNLLRLYYNKLEWLAGGRAPAGNHSTTSKMRVVQRTAKAG